MSAFSSAITDTAVHSLHPETGDLISWILNHESYQAWEHGMGTGIESGQTDRPSTASTHHLVLQDGNCGVYFAGHLADIVRSRFYRSFGSTDPETVDSGPLVLNLTSPGSEETSTASDNLGLVLVYQILSQRPQLYESLYHPLLEMLKDTAWNQQKCFRAAWNMIRELMILESLPPIVCIFDAALAGGQQLKTLERFLQLGAEYSIEIHTLVIRGASWRCTEDRSSSHRHLMNISEYQPGEQGLVDRLMLRAPWHTKSISPSIEFHHSSTATAGLLHYHVSQVNPSSSNMGVQRIIDTLPHGLSDTYHFLLSHISSDVSAWARRVLSWILFSFRPLSCAELSFALSAESCDLPDIFHGRRVAIQEDLRRVFGRLVVIGGGDVRLVHPTIREVLLPATKCSTSQPWYHFDPEDIKAVHEKIFRVCRRILETATIDAKTEDLEHSGGDSKKDTDADQSHHPAFNSAYDVATRVTLSEYAARFWGEHFQSSGRSSQVELFAELHMDTAEESAIELLAAPMAGLFCRLREPSNRGNKFLALSKGSCDCEQLQHAASYGLSRIVMFLLQDSTDGQITLALLAAAREGHIDTVRCIAEALVRRCADESLIDFGDTATRSNIRKAITCACRQGRDDILDVLLQPLLQNNKLSTGWAEDAGAKGLFLAAQFGWSSIVETLLKYETPMGGSSSHIPPAVYGATRFGHVEIVKSLVSCGADLWEVCNFANACDTALEEAAHNVGNSSYSGNCIC